MGHPARALSVLLFAGGCATCPEKIHRALNRTVHGEAASTFTYAVACPDRLDVHVEGRSDLSRVYQVEADGCMPFGDVGRVRVDGGTAQDVAHTLAALTRLPADRVRVRVAEHASRQLVIFGPGDGVQRVVPYVGPERVTDLLRRTGGLAPGTAFQSVHVVRPHVAAGRRPEVTDVDLRAILLKNDTSSDVRLEPNDQVYLGETRGASVARCLPPWLRAALPGMKTIDISDELARQ